jgi:regulator of protease activity HflC (stomatin/prohibitin superfamily)
LSRDGSRPLADRSGSPSNRRAPHAGSPKRAAILNAEGVKQSQILEAEGAKQSAILRAEGQRQSQILEAEGQAKAIDTVFKAIHEGKPDSRLLAYQYVQALPEIAHGEANKVWIIPSEFAQALSHLGGALGRNPAEDES